MVFCCVIWGWIIYLNCLGGIFGNGLGNCVFVWLCLKGFFIWKFCYLFVKGVGVWSDGVMGRGVWEEGRRCFV